MPLVQEELVAFPGEHDERSAIFAHFETKLLVEGPRAGDVAYEDFDDQLLGRIHVGSHGSARVAGYTSWERCQATRYGWIGGQEGLGCSGGPAALYAVESGTTNQSKSLMLSAVTDGRCERKPTP